MNRNWMSAHHVNEEYERKIEELLPFAQHNRKHINGTYYCSCVCYLNYICQDLVERVRSLV